MITKKTTLVLGAGASKPYGFPTGQELREKIINEGAKRFRGLNSESMNPEYYYTLGKTFAEKFDKSGVTSIDKFLNMQTQEYINIGKILIMAFIRDYEKHSKFNEHIRENSEDWYRVFWNKILEGVGKFEDLSFENIDIITFNYDRSLEHYLFQSIRNLFPESDINNEQIKKLMKTLRVNHVFGRVENMKWDVGGNFNEESVLNHYNNQWFDYNLLLKKINEINIINEVEKDTQQYKRIIENSKVVYFIGFGFLEENMKLLGAPFKKVKSNNTIYKATAWHISNENIHRYYAKYFTSVSLTNSIFHDCDCATLLRNHLD